MIAYCVSCRSVRLPQQCSLLPEGIGCLKCGHYLLVLEGDFVTLSDHVKSVQKTEDNHSQVSGRGYTFSSDIMQVDLLDCEERLRMEPKDFDALMYLAKHAFSRFRYHDAERFLTALEGYYPQELDVKQLLASLYLIIKKYEMALALCEEVRRLDEHDAQSFFNLGLACYYSEKFFRAMTVFQRILDKETDPILIKQSTVYLADLKSRIEMD